MEDNLQVETIKKKAGRPKGTVIKLTEDDYLLLENGCAIGMTIPQLAKMIGVNEKTFDNMLKRDTRLREMKDQAVMKTHAFVGGQLLKKITEGDKGAIIFYMKTRLGWKDTTRNEVVVIDPIKEKQEQEIAYENFRKSILGDSDDSPLSIEDMKIETNTKELSESNI